MNGCWIPGEALSISLAHPINISETRTDFSNAQRHLHFDHVLTGIEEPCQGPSGEVEQYPDDRLDLRTLTLGVGANADAELEQWAALFDGEVHLTSSEPELEDGEIAEATTSKSGSSRYVPLPLEESYFETCCNHHQKESARLDKSG